MALRVVNKIFGLLGYAPKGKAETLPVDIAGDAEFMLIYNKCRPYTMTSVERMYALYQSVKYLVGQGIPGDFVECGVWRGGSSMIIAMTLLQCGITDRPIWLYDTFEGMSEPGSEDKSFSGDSAVKLLEKEDKSVETSIWCYSSIDDVKKNLFSTGYPASNIHFIKGKVEDTLPSNSHSSISLLRLDTDWYESTKIELQLLYPRLYKGGVLIIDDFGHWEGAKKAVVEYFNQTAIPSLLCRIDYTGRLMVKAE